MKRLKYDKNTVVAEIAGKDSIAAIIKYSNENPQTPILPTIAIIPPEENRHHEMDEYLKELQRYLNKDTLIMYDPIYIDGSKYWWTINKYIHEITTKYGFFTYCIGCHGVIHAIRIPIAKELSKRVITGERHIHDGKRKTNQSHAVIRAFSSLFHGNDIEYITPIIGIEDSNVIDEILRPFRSECEVERPRDIGCILSGNLKDETINQYMLGPYLYEYLIPGLNEIVREMEKEKWDLKMLD